MFTSLSVLWKRLLNIGSVPVMDHLQLMRLHVVNGLVFIGAGATLLYVAIFTLIGSKGALEGLAVMPALAVVIFLNYRRYHVAARMVTIHVTQFIVFILALSDRQTGTEYVLLVLALSSIIVFEKQVSIITGFFSSCALYLIYVVIDHQLPFTPKPDTPYLLVNNAMIFLCGVWIASLLLIFRSTTFMYAADLREAAREIRAMNVVLQNSNQQLFARTEDLDLVVRRQNMDLQNYKQAMDVHLMSATSDRKGRILSVNQKFTDILGIRREDVLGKIFTELNPKSGELREMITTLNEGRPYRSEMLAHTRTHGEVWIDVLGIPLESPDGDGGTFLYLSIPISTRKALEIVHNRALVGLEAIAHRTSHEIRGPMARILGLSLLLERGLIKEYELPDIASKMIISAKELNVATSALTEFILEHEKELGSALT